MNRAALAARVFLAITILPATAAAGYAVYEYRHQEPLTPAYHVGDTASVTAFPSKGRLLGVFAPTLPHAGQQVSDTAALKSFDHAVGHRATLTVVYLNWGSPFPARYITDAAKLGARTVVELEPRGTHAPTLGQIAGGKGDHWLHSFAAAIAATRLPLALSFGPEMNGSWYTYGAGTARAYIRAFRHVHTVLLRAVGTALTPAAASRLLTFMWQPSAIHTSTPSPRPYWPGARYVGLIGLDGYYYHSTDTFHVIFDRTIGMLRKLSPKTKIMIGETAVGPVTGHQVWGIKNLFAGIKRRNLAGLIWFNRNQSGLNYAASKRVYHQDWRLQDQPKALRAFIAGLKADGPLASLPAMGSLLVVTGPPGAGKSSVARILADSFDQSVLVEGDAFFAFLARGAIEPWLPESGHRRAGDQAHACRVREVADRRAARADRPRQRPGRGGGRHPGQARRGHAAVPVTAATTRRLAASHRSDHPTVAQRSRMVLAMRSREASWSSDASTRRQKPSSYW